MDICMMPAASQEDQAAGLTKSCECFAFFLPEKSH